jgi:hypothetical protein
MTLAVLKNRLLQLSYVNSMSGRHRREAGGALPLDAYGPGGQDRAGLMAAPETGPPLI